LRQLIREYKALQSDVSHPYRLSAWLEFYRQLRPRSAISLAAMAIGPEGRKHPHQWRVPNPMLARASQSLLKLQRQIARCGSFDKLHRMVDSGAGGVRGIGDLTVYDTALRISSTLGCLPRRVYLYAGAREGYELLTGRPAPRTVTKASFKGPVATLNAREIEDFLCMFRHKFSGSRRPPASRCYIAVAGHRS
ncbi:MAG: hypothetical protein Q8S13_12720, partial [Dehalococcoidia bacterium]|nr:hypothetical protein [Dehalococcoidia bacterium]